MGKVIAISVFKGGTGKTTTAVSLAAALKSLGARVLLIDLDQQATATKYVGLNPEEKPTLYNVFLKEVHIGSAIRELPFGFYAVPANAGLAAIEDALEEGDEMMLRDFLSSVRDDFDYVIIDTPPGKAGLTINALSAADEVIITLQTERPALEGVNDLIKFTHDIVFRHNDNLKIRGILPTMYRKGTKHTVGILKRARHLWKEYVFPIEIPNTIEFSRSFEEKMPIIMSNPRHPGAQAYLQFARIIHGLPLEQVEETAHHDAVLEATESEHVETTDSQAYEHELIDEDEREHNTPQHHETS
jgi:chromosome partitioning protein